MEKPAIFVYPGHITKGLKGRILWHAATPTYVESRGDWADAGSVDLTRCINDPWPFRDGGPSCVMEVGSPR